MSGIEREVATRLRSVMQECEIKSNRELGEVCGVTVSAVNNWISGYNLPRVPEMVRLCSQTGITLDWLYRGSLSGMDAKLGMRLARIAGENDQASSKDSKMDVNLNRIVRGPAKGH